LNGGYASPFNGAPAQFLPAALNYPAMFDVSKIFSTRPLTFMRLRSFGKTTGD
jgi:hypothetical protein